jgi:Family of unknown function (DUF6411)
MTIAIIAAVCVVLLVLAFLFPRLSSGPERGVNKTLGAGERGAGKAPGPVGRLLRKPFKSSRKATSKSASTGRKARSKLPL